MCLFNHYPCEFISIASPSEPPHSARNMEVAYPSRRQEPARNASVVSFLFHELHEVSGRDNRQGFAPQRMPLTMSCFFNDLFSGVCNFYSS